jgi:hypothetical protein
MSDVFQVYGTLRAKVFDEERDYQIIGTTPGGLVGKDATSFAFILRSHAAAAGQGDAFDKLHGKLRSPPQPK